MTLSPTTVQRATDAWCAAWNRDHAPAGHKATFTGPTADEIITEVAGRDRRLYRAYETAVVKRARERLGIKQAPKTYPTRRRSPLADDEVAAIIALKRTGATYAVMREETGRGLDSIARVLRDAGLAGRKRA